MIRFVRLILVCMVALAGGSVSALAADPVHVRFDDPGICADAKVLNRISSRFRHQVRHVPHLPQVDIVDFYGIGERRTEPRHANSPIDRRYCHASAALSSGYTRDVWYLIERPMGFTGVGSNVEFCVAGFDRWHVYGGRCDSLR